MNLWKVTNNYTMPVIVERQEQDIFLPVNDNLNDLQIIIISGKLPPGTRLENNRVKGVPFEVSIDMKYSVVFRAEHEDEFEDRTINFIVTGSDGPQWITNQGLLPVGNNNAYFILDNSIVDFQLEAVDTDRLAGQKLEYFILDNDGNLPPGITLSKDGRLSGIVEPLLSLDNIYGDTGYDTGSYSSLPLDYGFNVSNEYESIYYDLFSEPVSSKIRNRRKLNRYYPFSVTVTDGDNFVKRDFNIYVVGDDFLSADNTVMQVGTGIFTADNTNIRTPVWLTPRDLGYRRANNNVTIFLETLNSPDLTGAVYYTLEKINDDNTRSRLPRGLTLNSTTGTITGTLLYQADALRNFKFTVRATRFADVSGAAEIFGTYYEDTLMGKSSFKVFKLDLSGLEDGINDATALINQDVTIENNTYRILNVDTSNSEYDVITLDQTLSPSISLIASRSVIPGVSEIYVNKLSESDKNILINKFLNFSNDESYKILDVIDSVTHPNETKIVLDNNISRNIAAGNNFGIALFKGDFFSELISTSIRDDINTPYKNKTFELKIIGNIDATIQWTSNSYLGTVRAEFVSTLFVKAEHSINNTEIIYKIVSGRLPNGLTMNQKGEIVGRVNQYEQNTTLGLTYFDESQTTWDNGLTTFDRQYKFTVRATDRFNLAISEKEFILDVDDSDSTLYTDIYVKPMLKPAQRTLYSNFISNSSIFEYSKIYRPGDENFGIQPELKMLVYAGIEVKNIEDYVLPTELNHKRKRFLLGDFKKAVAKNLGSNDVIYEVIYIQVIDPYQIGNNQTRKQFDIRSSTTNDKVRYISNIGNMRNNIKEIGKRERDYLPLWMKTPQENFEILNYTTAIPVCYCLPGTADDILLNIKNYINTTNFSIQGIDFDIDRYIIQRTNGNTREQFIVFPNYNFNI